MAHNISRIFIANFLFCCLWLAGSTQTIQAQIQQVNSPYSRVGIGTVAPTYFAANRALGGFATAFRSPLNVNYNNPASYSAIKRLMVFEVGVLAQGLWLNTDTQTGSTGNATISYAAFGFPINKHWTMSMGFMPHSSLNYDIVDTLQHPQLDTIAYQFQGQGQNYQLYWGNGFSYKGFSAGFNIGFLFGTYERTVSSRFFSIGNSFDNLLTETTEHRDFIWNVGLQYHRKLKNEVNLTLGVSSNTQMDVSSVLDSRWERTFLTSGIVQNVDTIYSNVGEKGTVVLPSKFSAGVALSKGIDWMVGFDITQEQWNNYQNFGKADSALVNSTRFNLAVSTVPDKNAIRKFWKNTLYRFGAYYDTGNIKLGDQNLAAYGFTIGAGFPVRRAASRLNLAFEVGSRGTIENNLIRETYFNATMGMTINDWWFIKRKYD